MQTLSQQWPQIIAAVVVAFTSWFVVALVKHGVAKLEGVMDNIATKEFVEASLAAQNVEIANMYAKSSTQDKKNEDFEFRMRNLELGVGILLESNKKHTKGKTGD